VVIRLSSGSTNTWRIKSNSDAKLAATPHRRSTVLVKHATRRFHRKLGRSRKSIYKKFPVNVQTTNVNSRSQIMYAEKWRNIAFVYTTVEYNKKNLAENVSNERAVDASHLAFAVRTSLKSWEE
jgi:hypothetical protein